MDESQPAYRRCNQATLNGLIDTTNFALAGALDGPLADPYDIDLLVDALRELSPHLPAADMFNGMLQLALGNLDNAIRVFADISNGTTSAVYGKALLALALQVKGDPEWRLAADEVLAAGGPAQAVALVRAIERQHDVLLAKEHAQRTGVWELPASLERAEGQAGDALPDTAASSLEPPAEFTHQQYLRL